MFSKKQAERIIAIKYEWQWCYGKRGNSSRSARISDHCTQLELEDMFCDDKDAYFYHPIDETRRVRPINTDEVE